MNQFSPIAGITPVVKNLIILNVLMALGSFTYYQVTGERLMYLLGLFIPPAEQFQPFQFVTHMFLHSPTEPFHLLFNMLMLWMMGSPLESAIGPKRFLILYFVSGFGASLLHLGINWYEYEQLRQAVEAYLAAPDAVSWEAFVTRHIPNTRLASQLLDSEVWNGAPEQAIEVTGTFMQDYLHTSRNIPTLGASGAVFGILAGFGLTFPQAYLRPLFLPIALPAPAFVLIMIVLELLLGISGSSSGIAHFAHLGGALFGMALIWFWYRKK